MTLALDQPSLISDIVSVDNAPMDATLSRSFAKYIRGMRHIEEAGATRQSEADKILATYEPDVGIRQFLLGNMYRTAAPAAAAAAAAADDAKEKNNVVKFRIPLDTLSKSLDNMGDFPFRNPDERRFEKPALFVRGTHSQYIPDEAIPLIGRFFPRFELVDIEAGHWLISEKPAEFLKCKLFSLWRTSACDTNQLYIYNTYTTPIVFCVAGIGERMRKLTISIAVIEFLTPKE